MAAKRKKRELSVEDIEHARAERNRQGFQVNLSVEEKILLKKAADADGLGLSTWIRQVALERASRTT